MGLALEVLLVECRRRLDLAARPARVSDHPVLQRATQLLEARDALELAEWLLVAFRHPSR